MFMGQKTSTNSQKNIGGNVKAHLVVVGFDEIVSNKYLSCIKEAIELGEIDSYSIIDLEFQKNL